MITRHLRLVLGTILIGLGMSGSVSAQMYRCGSSYQDHPCEAGQPSKTLNVPSAPAASAKAGTDSECAQRGNDSLKISWAREAGATAEKLSGQAKRPDERKLIADVYQKRGSAAEVRAAIEADCLAEKERLAQAAALAAAAAKLAGPPSAEPAAARGPSEADAKAFDKRRQQEEAAREAQRKKSRCDQIESDIEKIRQRQRAGATADGMDRLNQQRRDAEQAKRETGCGATATPGLGAVQ